MGVVYLIVLAIHLFALSQNDDSLATVSKPLLMIALIMFFFDRARNTAPKIKLFIFAALIFSLIGDTFLMFQQRDANNFTYGLAAFLIAHVFYILYFRGLRKINQAEPTPAKKVLAGLSIAYAVILLAILFPKLGSMTIPVIIYGAVISAMLVSCFFAFANWKSRFAIFSTLGAVLFVVSDSLLAFNKFHTPFSNAGFLVMLTYGFAQFFLVWGAIKNLNRASVPKEKAA